MVVEAVKEVKPKRRKKVISTALLLLLLANGTYLLSNPNVKKRISNALPYLKASLTALTTDPSELSFSNSNKDITVKTYFEPLSDVNRRMIQRIGLYEVNLNALHEYISKSKKYPNLLGIRDKFGTDSFDVVAPKYIEFGFDSENGQFFEYTINTEQKTVLIKPLNVYIQTRTDLKNTHITDVQERLFGKLGGQTYVDVLAEGEEAAKDYLVGNPNERSNITKSLSKGLKDFAKTLVSSNKELKNIDPAKLKIIIDGEIELPTASTQKTNDGVKTNF